MIGERIEKELSKEQYNYYLDLLDLLDEYERGPKEAYDEVVTKLCELVPKYKDEIIQSTARVYALSNDDSDYLTPDEISALLDE